MLPLFAVSTDGYGRAPGARMDRVRGQTEAAYASGWSGLEARRGITRVNDRPGGQALDELLHNRVI